jgi:hypothetical protein
MRSVWIFSTRIPFIALCFMLITGCNSSSATTKTVQTPTPLHLTSYPWKSSSLPVTGSPLLSYIVSPIDSKTVYACTGGASIGLWETHNAGQHWFAIPLPTTPGTNCSFSISTSQPQRIALLVNEASDNQRPCDRDTLYLSADSGNTWKHITHTSIAPAQAKNGYCTITTTAHSLYMWYSYGGGQNTPQLSLLERTDNDGATWSRADTAFGPGKLFFPPQVGKDENLAISVRNASDVSDISASLWMSHDAGRSWQRMGALPSQAGIFLLTTPQQGSSWPTRATPFYALVDEQIPSNLYALRTFESINGREWFAIPSLPTTKTTEAHPGLLQSLSVTADGHLLIFGVNPKIGMPDSVGVGQKPMTTFWLWSWNTHTDRWQVLSSPLTHVADEGCGLCWNGQLSSNLDHTRILSVYHWQDKDSFFRVQLPDLA